LRTHQGAYDYIIRAIKLLAADGDRGTLYAEWFESNTFMKKIYFTTVSKNFQSMATSLQNTYYQYEAGDLKECTTGVLAYTYFD
jgi:hypothetical protein